MADAGIAVVSWFAVMKVVVCFEPLQLMVAAELKLLPLIVSMNGGSPAFAVFGTSCMMTGTTPAVGMGVLGALYPPHPNHSSVSNNTEIIFMTFSRRMSSLGMIQRRCAHSVTTASFSCKGNVCRAEAERLYGEIHQAGVNYAPKAEAPALMFKNHLFVERAGCGRSSSCGERAGLG